MSEPRLSECQMHIEKMPAADEGAASVPLTPETENERASSAPSKPHGVPDSLRLRLAELAYERLHLCPDHRDKATGRCIVCVAEERVAAERPDLAAQIRTLPRHYFGSNKRGVFVRWVDLEALLAGTPEREP